MMTLRYIFHSCFLLETSQCILVFDLVMFPVDGRIGNGYTLGGRQFIEPTTSREQYQARLIIAEARRRKTKSTLQGWNVCPDALCHEWI